MTVPSDARLVRAPLAGAVLALAQVPDDVFAAEMLGSGLAIDPGPGTAHVVAPVRGTIGALHPHAFVVVTDDGAGVLVHLGIDTVGLDGEGFTLHAGRADTVDVGDPVVTFDPDLVRSRGLSAVCPVVLMEAEPGSTTDHATGTVAPGAPLFRWSAA